MVRSTQLLHPPHTPTRLLSAATVLLLRDGPQGLEVLMTRRAMTASFAPGAYVFPGGGIDAADTAAHAHAKRRATQSDTHLTPAIAAIRESFEELGILLARHPNGQMASADDIAALLDAGGIDPTVINGGIINSYGSNARLGKGEYFPYTDTEQIFAELCRASTGGAADYTGATWQRIEDEMGMFWPVPEVGHPGTPRLYEGGQFHHPDGKARFHAVPYKNAG